MRMYYWQARLHDGKEYTSASGLGVTLAQLMYTPVSIDVVHFMPRKQDLPKFSLKPTMEGTFKIYETWFRPFCDYAEVLKEQVIYHDGMQLIINLDTGIMKVNHV